MFCIRFGNQNNNKKSNRVWLKNELENAVSTAWDCYSEDMLGDNCDELVDWVEVVNIETNDVIFSIKRDSVNVAKPIVFENKKYTLS